MENYINCKMVEDGLMAKVITAKLDGNDIMVTIGDGWFWINGDEFKWTDINDIPFSILVTEIKDALDDFYGHQDTFEDEYLYYYYYLCENI